MQRGATQLHNVHRFGMAIVPDKPTHDSHRHPLNLSCQHYLMLVMGGAAGLAMWLTKVFHAGSAAL